MDVNNYIKKNAHKMSDRELSQTVGLSVSATRHRRYAQNIWRDAESVQKFKAKAMRDLRFTKKS